MGIRLRHILAVMLVLSTGLSGFSALAQAQQTRDFPAIVLPPGFGIEKAVSGLTYATAVEWDDQGRMYVLEAGGQFLEEPPPARLMRIENGQATEVVNLTDNGVADSAVGLEWHDGAFYISARDPVDRTGAVFRVTLDGQVTKLLTGIIDSQSEHQINDLQVGPDGMMYLASGPAGNSAVMGIDNAPFIMRSPMVHTTSCQDIVLTGQNFGTPDFRTDDPSDMAMTGAFVPFGTETMPGQVIEGNNKCGGAILVFDLDDPEGTIRPYAHGFRNVIGFAWDDGGQMYAAVNGYDIRGSRPVRDEYDATYRVEEGAWYGFPDFSAALEPLTDPEFDSPDSQQAPIYVNGELQGKFLGFVIDHAASGLTVADRSLIAGLHGFNSSPSKLDVAPDSWGDWAGQLFVAEWGDLAPPTNLLRDKPIGYQVSRLDPATGKVVPFAHNLMPGPASKQEAKGMGLERPFDVKFGPDGAMYIVDYGIANINPARAAEGQVPYEFPPETGAIWKVTHTGAPAPAGCQYFDETGHYLCDDFRMSWDDNGGLPVFGYPISGELMEHNADLGQMLSTQYFERQRFELHPENAGTPYKVLLGRLGVQVLGMQGRDWMDFTMANPNAPHYFDETGHAIAPEFWEYWSSHGLDYGDPGVSFRESLLLFGYPISEATLETNPNGDTVLTQWFERARFEYHPSNPEGQRVLLGHLGSELLGGLAQ
ncbi:MAG: sugar dehydrogenase [Chloroflexota bacterium]|nr:sugar dehydrogenase [Chloroflexota bacterium]